jgi:hypothetical protein
MSLIHALSCARRTRPFCLPSGLETSPSSVRELVRIMSLPAIDGLDEGAILCDVAEPEAQGIAHCAGDSWFLITAERLYRIEGWGVGSGRLMDPYARNRLSDLVGQTDLEGHCVHMSDGQYYRGVLFCVVRYPAEDTLLILGVDRILHAVGYARMNQGAIGALSADGCCAVNPWNEHLYVPERGERGQSSVLHAYDVSRFYHRASSIRDRMWGTEIQAPRVPERDITLSTRSGLEARIPHVQGLAFSPNGRLYVAFYARGESHIGPIWHNYISVYNMLTGEQMWESEEVDYPSPSRRDEIEGIGLKAGDGHLYVSVNVNGLRDSDDRF